MPPPVTQQRPPSKEQVAERVGLRSIWNAATSRVAGLAQRAATLYTRATPIVLWATDFTWAVASSAVILSIPILVELQRETTVMVLQRQREHEISQIQEQTRAQSGGFLQQAQALGTLLTGTPPPS